MGKPLTRPEALWLLVAVGTFFGALRVLALAVANLGLGRYVQQGINLLWTGPLGVTLLVLAGGTLVWLLGAVVPSLRRAPPFIFCIVWIAATSLALNVSGLYLAAAMVLGAGVATVAMRITQRDAARVSRVCRRVAIGGMSGAGLAFFCLVVSAPALETWLAGRVAAPSPGSPNILLIVLDTVRAKSLGAYGNPQNTSPFLDSVARSGVRFAEAFATAPWTTPTHASMMTGRWPTDLGVDWDRTLDERAPTVAEVLSRAGYRTAGFVGNPGKAGRSSGIGRGFKRYEDYTISFWNVLRGSRIGDRIASSAWLRTLMDRESLPDRKRSPEVTAAFLGWLDEPDTRPFFVFLNYFDAHHPYEAPPEVAARFGVEGNRSGDFREPAHKVSADDPKTEVLLRHYEAAIAYQDDQLRQLFAELERRGALENTLVVITSDHGEEFGEHGLMRHGNSLYRAALHVPLIVSFPKTLEGGRVVSTPVSVRSIAGSLADVVPGLDATPFRGPSLFDVMADPSAGEPVFSTVDAVTRQPSDFPVHYGPLYALLHGGHRYIVNAEGAEELYRLEDVDERTNLASDPGAQPVLEELRSKLSKIVGRRGSRP